MQFRSIIFLVLMLTLFISGCNQNRKSVEYTDVQQSLNSNINLNPDSSYAKKCIDSSKIQKDVMCIQVYEPVCGCDGKTYSNSCMASVNGVVKWTEGECDERK